MTPFQNAAFAWVSMLGVIPKIAPISKLMNMPANAPSSGVVLHCRHGNP